MGSKQALSNGNEPQELTALVSAFQSQNKVLIVMHNLVVTRKGFQDTLYVALAVPEEGEQVVAKYLGSASAVCWASEFKSLMGLYTSLLYKLDFMLAELEWGRAREQR